MTEAQRHTVSKYNEKRDLILKACKELQDALVSEDMDRKKLLAKELRTAVTNLCEWLNPKQTPGYLLQLPELLARYQAMTAPGKDVLSKLLETQSNLPRHVWTEEDDSALALDLDAIFAEFVGQSRLPELLDQLLKLLVELEAQSEQNSGLIRMSLEHAIATIRRTHHASFPSLKMAWEFVMRLLGNLFWEQAAMLLPGAVPLINALKKTIADTDNELNRTEQHLESEVNKYLARTASLIGEKSALTLYDLHGDALRLPPTRPRFKGNA